MLKFISFGSGSSGNCSYLFNEHNGLLIDAGVGLRSLKNGFRTRGLSLNHISAIILTHDHADHVKSVGKLSEQLGVPVYATEAVHQGIDKNYGVACKVKATLRRTLEKEVTTTVGEMEVTPFEVPHDSTDCVGFHIRTDGVTFCLVTDAGHITDIISQHIADADYLVIEANHDLGMLDAGHYPPFLKRRIHGERGHLENRDCGEAIWNVASSGLSRLRHVWLCHLSHENNRPDVALETVKEVLERHGLNIGADFQLDVLPRGTCSPLYELASADRPQLIEGRLF